MSEIVMKHVQLVNAVTISNTTGIQFPRLQRKKVAGMSHHEALSPTANTIFLSAVRLFAQNGYQKTNIRQIAEAAQVSLGLVNHYFESKRNLGYYTLTALIGYVVSAVDESLDRDDLLLYDATATRCVNQYLYHGPFRSFYFDSLEEDIFFRYVQHNARPLVKEMQEQYGFTISDDMALLYSCFIPFAVEKTLVLKKRMGYFPSINEEDIPYQIIASNYNNFIPHDVILAADQESRRLTPTILRMLSPYPSDHTLLNRLEVAMAQSHHSYFCTP